MIDVDDCRATSDLAGVDSETPRESQTLRLPPGRLDPLASWADGTALAAAARVRARRSDSRRADSTRSRRGLTAPHSLLPPA